MSSNLPVMGEQTVDSHRMIVRVREESGYPKEILILPEYWNPDPGHIFFMNGHGFEVQDVTTFFHFDAPGFNSMVVALDVKPRPDL